MYRQSEKNLLNSNTSCTCPGNMVNFSLLTAQICWRVWGTPANFIGFLVLASLLHGTLVVGVSQTLQHWTEGATYIWQGGHHVGHWPIFLVCLGFFCFFASFKTRAFACFHISFGCCVLVCMDLSLDWSLCALNPVFCWRWCTFACADAVHSPDTWHLNIV